MGRSFLSRNQQSIALSHKHEHENRALNNLELLDNAVLVHWTRAVASAPGLTAGIHPAGKVR